MIVSFTSSHSRVWQKVFIHNTREVKKTISVGTVGATVLARRHIVQKAKTVPQFHTYLRTFLTNCEWLVLPSTLRIIYSTSIKTIYYIICYGLYQVESGFCNSKVLIHAQPLQVSLIACQGTLLLFTMYETSDKLYSKVRMRKQYSIIQNI